MKYLWCLVLTACVIDKGPVGPRPPGQGAAWSAQPAAAPEAAAAQPAGSGPAPGTLGGPPGLPSATGGGCFGGSWRGVTGIAGSRRNIRLELVQSGTELRGKLEFHGYEGLMGTEELTGTADCAREAATLHVGAATGDRDDTFASSYTLQLVRKPGYALRFEGEYPCGHRSCPGEVKAELQQ